MAGMGYAAESVSHTARNNPAREMKTPFDGIMADLRHLENKLRHITKQQRSAVEETFTKSNLAQPTVMATK